MSGPPKTPSNLVQLRGNPGRRPLNQNEPKPTVEVPPRPSHLVGHARKEWDRITPLLERYGLLTKIDHAGVEAYCVVYGRWVEAEKKLRKSTMVVTVNGKPMTSPWLTIASAALVELRKYLAEFGMTPASRSRISAEKPAEDTDDWSQFAV